MKNILLVFLAGSSLFVSAQNATYVNQSCKDMDNYVKLATEVAEYRKNHLLSVDSFKVMAARPNVIILDTRSLYFYDAVHVKGAIHLDFSDFTYGSLAGIIPSRETIILIYCNNNFYGEERYLQTKNYNPRPLLLLNYPLNIPVMVTLFGYGYRNVFELGEYIDAYSGTLELEGIEVGK